MQFQKRFPRKVEADILKKLSQYLSASLPVKDSLELIEMQTDHKKRKETLIIWRESIEGGKTLAQAFEIGAIRVSRSSAQAAILGEKSAMLAESLREAYIQLEKIITIKKKIILATSYPAVILLGTLGLVSGLMLFVFPKIIPVFTTLKVTLPLSTKILIAVSTFLTKSWLLLFVVAGVLLAMVICLIKFYAPVRKFFEFVYVRLPLMGSVVRARVLCEAFDSLHTLLRGGEQLSQGFTHVADVVRFTEYKAVFIEAAHSVAQGKSVATYFKSHKKLVPTYVSGILSVGERTGNVESSVKDVADIARAELDDHLHVFTATLEPILMISMSAVIGFIALSIILPIYGVTSNFQQ